MKLRCRTTVLTLLGTVLATTPARAVHNIHLTYTRMVVDGASVVARVRLFKDDLEKALAAEAKTPTFTVTATPAADSLFARYWNTHVTVRSDGDRLIGRVLQSGPDPDVTDQEMWIYLVELPARRPVRSLSVRVALLFDHFRDQRNLVTLLRMPAEERHSLYFVAGDAGEQRLTFER